MADKDMTPTNGFDPVASYARLSERVEGQGKDLVDIRSNMNTGFNQVNANINALANETRGAINAITNELRGNSRTQWPVIWSAIGVSFVVLAAVGGLAYQPVVSNQTRLEDALVRLTEVSVTRQELDARAARGTEDRTRMEAGITQIRADLVPRAELDRVFESYDQRLLDHQRQIDEGKTALGSTYSLRDYIQRLTERLDTLEQRAMMGRPSFQP